MEGVRVKRALCSPVDLMRCYSLIKSFVESWKLKRERMRMKLVPLLIPSGKLAIRDVVPCLVLYLSDQSVQLLHLLYFMQRARKANCRYTLFQSVQVGKIK